VIGKNTGRIKLHGYGVNIEDKVVINLEDARGLIPFHPALNQWRNRAWNYILVNTPTHVIQIAFIDLAFAQIAEAKIFEVKEPQKSLRAAKEVGWSAMKLNKRSIAEENAEYLGTDL